MLGGLSIDPHYQIYCFILYSLVKYVVVHLVKSLEFFGNYVFQGKYEYLFRNSRQITFNFSLLQLEQRKY